MKFEQNKKRTGRYEIQQTNDTVIVIEVSGRVQWALEELMRASERGCTPIDTPGPRWSHYIWVLRGEGVDIETVTEKHGGPFSGTHARYVLRSVVVRLPKAEAA